uniref:G protein gamma domain-containing protein n=1 Tax=Timema cristinae TaxID=61476 RepID=A0A7R9D0T8_TIMCR|nr:unnamed protein product [Timema cristinae]
MDEGGGKAKRRGKSRLWGKGKTWFLGLPLVFSDVKWVDFLRSCLVRTRVKVSQALDNLLEHCETYIEYDPFLTGLQPSSPWISEDPIYWQLNSPLVDVPTEKRVKRWALSMEELVSDPTEGTEKSCAQRQCTGMSLTHDSSRRLDQRQCTGVSLTHDSSRRLDQRQCTGMSLTHDSSRRLDQRQCTGMSLTHDSSRRLDQRQCTGMSLTHDSSRRLDQRQCTGMSYARFKSPSGPKTIHRNELRTIQVAVWTKDNAQE